MEQKEFLEAMSKATRERSPFFTQENAGWIFLILFFAIGAFIAFFWIYDHRFYLRGRWIFLQRRWRKEQISLDRRKERLEVVIQLPYENKPFRTKTLNLSPRGMYILMNPPLVVGENFRFLLVLPDGEKINARAEVRWSQDKPSPYTDPGMGCKFYQLLDEDQILLQKYLHVKPQRS